MFSTHSICGTYLCSLIHYDTVDLEESNIEGDSYTTKLDSYVSPSVQNHHIVGINQDAIHEETSEKLGHSEPETDFRSEEDSSVSEEESSEESHDVESEKENKVTLTKLKTKRTKLKVEDSTSSRTSSSSCSSSSSSSSCGSSSTSDDNSTESDSEVESDQNKKNKTRAPPLRKPAIYSRCKAQTKVTEKSATMEDFIPLRSSPNKKEFVQVQDDLDSSDLDSSDLDSSTTDSDSDSESDDDLTAMVKEAGLDGSGHSSESSESDNCIDLVSEDEGDEKVAI